MIIEKIGKYSFALILGILCALVFSTSHILIDKLPFFNYECSGNYPVTNEAFGMELIDAYFGPSEKDITVPLTYANYLFKRYPKEVKEFKAKKDKKPIKTPEEYTTFSTSNREIKEVINRDSAFAAVLKTIKKAQAMNNFYKGTGYGVIIFFLLVLFSSYLNRFLEYFYLKRSEEELRAELNKETSYLRNNRDNLETRITILKNTKDILLEDYAGLEHKHANKLRKHRRDFEDKIEQLNKKLKLEKEQIDREIRKYKTDSHLNRNSKDDDEDNQIVKV